MTKFKVTDDIVEIIGHSKSVEECNSITNIANALKNSPFFIAQEVRQGYAKFQSIKYNEEKLFPPEPCEGTMTFDSHIQSVSAFGNTWTTSGQTVYGANWSPTIATFTVVLDSGYVLDTVTASGFLVVVTDIASNTFTAERQQATSFFDASFTITSKVAATGYSVTYVENGGTPTQTDLTEQSALPNPLPTIAKANFIFGGWYTNEALTTQAVAGATISADTTLYSKWTFDGIEVTATGGSVILATAGKYCDKNIRVVLNN